MPMPELLPTPSELAAMPELKRARVLRHAQQLVRELEQAEQARQDRMRSLELERIRVTPQQLEAERIR